MKPTKRKSFGAFFEELRQRSHLTLREFCNKAVADAANISRMERGLMSPPRSREILERYAKALDLQEGSDDWYTLFDLAAMDKGMMPADIMENADLVKILPMFFRNLREQKPTRSEMRRAAEKMRVGGTKS